MNAQVAQRFFEKVDITDGCWNWKAVKNKDGYGRLTASNRNYRAHRMSWMLYFGEIQEGLFVCHKCDNPSCVNPQHLFLGTAKDNAVDRNRKGRHRDDNGENHPCAKLNTLDVIYIRAKLSQGMQGKRLAQKFGMSQSMISQIKLGHKWKSIL